MALQAGSAQIGPFQHQIPSADPEKVTEIFGGITGQAVADRQQFDRRRFLGSRGEGCGNKDQPESED